MSVFRRAGSPFYSYNFWFDGQHIQCATKLKSRRQTQKAEDIHKAELALGKYGLGPKKEIPKFSDYAKQYLEYSKANKLAYVVELYIIPRTLVPFFGKFRLNEILPLLVEKFKQKRLADGLKKSSINREIGLLKSMLNSAVKWQLVDANAARDAKLFRLDDPPADRVLSYEEEEKLLKACDDPELQCLAPHLKPILMVALYTGLRRGEVCRLRWADLDFENSVLTVGKSKTRAGRGRIVDLNSALRALLLTLWHEATSGEWVFPSPKIPGDHIGDIKNSFRRAVRIAGIPHITFHQLRHTFCTRLGDGGVPLPVIQELAGHASIVTTRRYMHPANELKRKAVESIWRSEKSPSPTTVPTTPDLTPKRRRTAKSRHHIEKPNVSRVRGRRVRAATAT